MLRVLYVAEDGPAIQYGSGYIRWLAHHPGIEFMCATTRVYPTMLGEPLDAYTNTDWQAFTRWLDGEWRVNNGYQNECIEWKHIEDRWQENHSEPPDLIFVYESTFTPCGKKTIFEGVPVAFIYLDVTRGIDHGLRVCKSIGANYVFQTSEWHQPLFSMANHVYPDEAPPDRVDKAPNSGMRIPADRVFCVPCCADPFYFNEAPTKKVLDVMWCGNEPFLMEGGRQAERTFGPHPSGYDVVCKFETAEKRELEYHEYQQRGALLWKMFHDPQVPLNITHPQFEHNYARMLRSSKIVWHCQGGWNATIHDNPAYRVWQAAACGACVFTNETIGLSDYFVLGEEIETYRLYYEPTLHLFEWFDYQAMRNKLLTLLAQPKRLEEIGRAAAARIRKEYLPEHWMNFMFEKMGITP